MPQTNRSKTIFLAGELNPATGLSPSIQLPSHELQLVSNGVETAARLELISACVDKTFYTVHKRNRTLYFTYTDITDPGAPAVKWIRIDISGDALVTSTTALATTVAASAQSVISAALTGVTVAGDVLSGRIRLIVAGLGIGTTVQTGAHFACFAENTTIGGVALQGGDVHILLGLQTTPPGSATAVNACGAIDNGAHVSKFVPRLRSPLTFFVRSSVNSDHVATQNMEPGVSNSSSRRAASTPICAMLDTAYPEDPALTYVSSQDAQYASTLSSSQLDSIQLSVTDRYGESIQSYSDETIRYLFVFKWTSLIDGPVMGSAQGVVLPPYRAPMN